MAKRKRKIRRKQLKKLPKQHHEELVRILVEMVKALLDQENIEKKNSRR